jgi:hypothetical protein
MSHLTNRTLLCSLLLILTIASNYFLTSIGADENLKLLTLSFVPYLFYIFSRKKYILFISTLMLFKFLSIGLGLFNFDYFYVDGEAFYNAYLIVKDVFIGGGEVPQNQQHILNSKIWLSVGFYYYLIDLIMSSSNLKILLAFNYLLIFFSVLMWVKVNNYSKTSIFSSVLLIISPESYIFGLYIGKEIILLFVAMSAIYLIQNIYSGSCAKYYKYLALIVIIIAGTLIRPYFINIVIAYLFFLNPIKIKTVFYLLIIYLFAYVLVTYHFNLDNLYIHLRNFVANYLGLLASPNFLRVINWDNFFFSTLFHTTGLFAILLSVILTMKVVPVIRYGFLSVVFYAIPLALVVTTYSHQADPSIYAFYIPRSRFPIILILYTMFAGSILHIGSNIKYRLKLS